MPRYSSDKRKSEFSYYLGAKGAKLFASRSEKSRKGILTRLANELGKIVSNELATNERFASDLRKELGAEFGAEHLFDTKHPLFSWAKVAEVIELVQTDTMPVQLFRDLIARNTIQLDGKRRYMNSTNFRKGIWKKSEGIEVRGLIRAKGDKPVVLQSKSDFTTIVGSKGAASVATRTGVLHLPSGKSRKIVARPKTK